MPRLSQDLRRVSQDLRRVITGPIANTALVGPPLCVFVSFART